MPTGQYKRKPLTAETRERIRQALLGKKRSPEQCANISAGLTGRKLSPETRAKISKSLIGNNRSQGLLGEKSPSWKGDKVNYYTMHGWVAKRKGKPKHCEHCGLNDLTKTYHWANKSKQYKRDLDDWIRLCVPCHSKFDEAPGRRGRNGLLSRM